MPKFLDAHSFRPFTEDELKQAQNAPRDEFGVTHHNILYNQNEDKVFCLLEAPNKEAVESHHNKAGVKCDWIIEVSSTK
jgi:hypothetical protein